MIIDTHSRIPIYQQIVNQYKALISCNVLEVGDQLESVRSLSANLGINPNTIQKAYAELENQHICSSAPGKGRFVTADAKSIIKQSAAMETSGLDREIYTLALSGLGIDEITEIVGRAFTKAQYKLTAIRNK